MRRQSSQEPHVSRFKLSIVPVTPFAQNCAILVDVGSGRAAVIDPGGDLSRIEAALAETGAEVETILLTHGHIDHAGAATDLAERLSVPIVGPHKADAFLLENLPATARQYGLREARAVSPTRWLEEGDQVGLGGLVFDILHCPGHSPGSVVFALRRDPAESDAGGFAIVGDVLFNGSVGRTDLPGGSHAQLIQAIKTKLLPLGDDVAFHCGHGPMSTIGAERRGNPFLV